MLKYFKVFPIILLPITALGYQPAMWYDCNDCYWGYLTTVGPTELRFKCRCRPIDRHNLVSIAAIEAEYQKKATESAQKENKLLEEENARNIAIVAKGYKPLVVESPSPIPVPAILTPQTADNNYSNLDPGDFPFYIEHQLDNHDHKDHKGHRGHGNGDTIDIPFQMPFQTGPAPLNNASKAVYVQQ